jgi:uncharacterized membrane protein YhaH (DUF805 family)
MINFYVLAFKRWLDFKGRSRRSEYWYFTLVNLIIAIVLIMIEQAIGIGGGDSGNGPISSLYTLVVLVPGLAVSFRRMHDIGKSAWWLLIGLIPLLGFIVIIVWFIGAGQPGRNAYGPNPKDPNDSEPASAIS